MIIFHLFTFTLFGGSKGKIKLLLIVGTGVLDGPFAHKRQTKRREQAARPTNKIHAYLINRIIFVGRGDSRIARSTSKRHLRRVILEWSVSETKDLAEVK